MENIKGNEFVELVCEASKNLKKQLKKRKDGLLSPAMSLLSISTSSLETLDVAFDNFHLPSPTSTALSPKSNPSARSVQPSIPTRFVLAGAGAVATSTFVPTSNPSYYHMHTQMQPMYAFLPGTPRNSYECVPEMERPQNIQDFYREAPFVYDAQSAMAFQQCFYQVASLKSPPAPFPPQYAVPMLPQMQPIIQVAYVPVSTINHNTSVAYRGVYQAQFSTTGECYPVLTCFHKGTGV